MYAQKSTPTRWNIWRSILSAWALLLCIGLATSVASAQATAKGASSPSASNVTTCPIGGVVLPSPNTALDYGPLNDVEVISPNDVWAVGFYGTFDGSARTLVLHWNGDAWSVVPSPNPDQSGAARNVLYAIDAVSASDIWAVGQYCGNYYYPCGTLTLHWDGNGWTYIPSPGGFGPLRGVEAISANDVWAVGGSTFTLTLHWNGSQWSHVPSPSPFPLSELGGTNTLMDVEEVAPGEVWAVGYASNNDPEYRCGPDQMVLRWTGTQWEYVVRPVCGPSQNNVLNGISATAANNIWVVGRHGGQAVARRWNGSTWTTYPLPCSAEWDIVAISPNDVWAVGLCSAHWDGTQWSAVSMPSGGSLVGVDALASNNVWSVGTTVSSPYYRDAHNLTMRWNGTQWSRVTAEMDLGYDTLRAVEVIAPDNIWAVGFAGISPAEGSDTRTMIQHWDGTRWSVIPSPNPASSRASYLYDISAVSASDIWAVGSYVLYEEYNRPSLKALSLHWDGTQWSIVPVPGMRNCSNPLAGVKAIAANDVWAVGQFYCDPYHVNTTPIHWNGQQWTSSSGLQWSPRDTARLLSIDGVSSNDLWAVGEYRYEANPYETFIVRWNGQQWARIPSSNVGTDNNRLKGVTAIAANDVWAVGYSGPPGAGHALAMHWDGTEWRVVPTPDIGESSYFLGVGSSATGEVWAVGNYISGGVPHTLVERWDGSQWEVVSSPSPSNGNNYLWGVAPVPGDYVYAVGDYKVGLAQHTLIERFSQATFTPFSDVPEGSTFSAPIRCLTCRGIISGYEDGTFRPNNNVTRGQLSKIVSNSANFNEDPGAQIFEDVPPGSTFYDWVQRLARRGHISGYPCGGVGEPCISGNKPYFRPNANATRAQISKIVSNARGYNDPAGVEIFEDVPPSHGFYEWIQRLAQHGAMGGYECGGAGEPCGAERRPYFRPNNNATRGQTSKIVSNTFFPECNP